jgi:hypothetical protein
MNIHCCRFKGCNVAGGRGSGVVRISFSFVDHFSKKEKKTEKRKQMKVKGIDLADQWTIWIDLDGKQKEFKKLVQFSTVEVRVFLGGFDRMINIFKRNFG